MDPLELLFAALNSPNGIVLFTDDTERLKNLLYKTRKDYHETNPLLASLTIRTSPDSPMEVWIVRDAKTPAQTDSLQGVNHPEEIDSGGDRLTLPSPEIQPERRDPGDPGTIPEEE